MSRPSVRYVMFAAFVLVALSGPGPFRAPTSARGIGCRGAPVPKTPTLPARMTSPPPQAARAVPGVPRMPEVPRSDVRLPGVLPPVVLHPAPGVAPAQAASAASAETPAIVQRAAGLADKKDWPLLARELGRALEEPTLPLRLRRDLTSALSEVRKLALLEDCGRDLAAKGRAPAIVSDLTTLPDPLKRDLRGLASLSHLGDELTSSWKNPPEFAKLESALADVRATPGGEPLADALATLLAIRAHQEGHAKLTRLLPAGLSLDDLPPRLRDVKLARPASRVADGNPAMLAPEAPAAGVRPRVRESAMADLPVVGQEATQHADGLRGRVQLALEEQRTVHTLQVHRLIDQARRPLSAGNADEDEEERARAEQHRTRVEQALKRPLSRSERALARGMYRRGETPARSAELLREAAGR